MRNTCSACVQTTARTRTVVNSVQVILPNVGILLKLCSAQPDRMRPLGKPPASSALLPLQEPVAALSKLQRRYETIRVWSYAIFIVIEAVIDRKLAVET